MMCACVVNLLSLQQKQNCLFFRPLGHSNKCFVSHRPPSREGGSVGRAKEKRNKHMPVKAGLLSTKAWLRGPFVCNQMV